MLRQVGQLWFRLVFYYLLYPWKLTRFIHPRVDEADQNSEGELFFSSTTCCIGVPLVPLRNQVKSAADLASHKKFLRTGFNCARAQTIAEEEGLKRSKVHSSTVSGNPQSLATVCSNHVLSDAVSMHSKLKTMLGTKEAFSRKRAVEIPKRPVLILIGL